MAAVHPSNVASDVSIQRFNDLTISKWADTPDQKQKLAVVMACRSLDLPRRWSEKIIRRECTAPKARGESNPIMQLRSVKNKSFATSMDCSNASSAGFFKALYASAALPVKHCFNFWKPESTISF